MEVKRTQSSGDFKADSQAVSTPDNVEVERIEERERKAQEEGMKPVDMSWIENPVPEGETFTVEVVQDEKEVKEELKARGQANVNAAAFQAARDSAFSETED